MTERIRHVMFSLSLQQQMREVGRHPWGLALTLVVNWLIKPLTTAGLGALFF